jgi:hypothetical protein
MDKLKLIQQLYEPESSDFAPDELGPEAQAELQSLRKIKRALDGLPAERPEASTLRAVMREAARQPRRQGLMGLIRPIRPVGMRIFSSPALPRLAAVAAMLVVAIGVALWMRPAGPSPQMAAEGVQPEEEELGAVAKMREFAREPAVSDEVYHDLDAVAAVADSVPAFILEWDNTEEVRTLYWQVEALRERSAERLWDASVPIETRPLDAWNRAYDGIHHVGAQP